MNKAINRNFCILVVILAFIFSFLCVNTIVDTQSNYNSIINTDSVNTMSSELKLFGIIPINKSEKSNSSKYVQLGGYPLGLSINTNGLYITSKVNVVTKDGAICPVEDCDILAGDTLYAIDGNLLLNVNDVNKYIEDKEIVTLTVKRGESQKDYKIKPAIDVLSNTKKLGLLLQDSIEGIGTMTYTDNGKFYALGHTIKDMNGQNIQSAKGRIYNANIVGYVKGQKGKAGELNGSFSTMSDSIGIINTNNNYGVYGELSESLDNPQIMLGSKEDVQPGKAYIYTTIEGNEPQKYEIQIIKASHQNFPSEKSMVLRIVDERLLSTTGGIVQGMSGSPIIQNDKLVGAVTHVFVSDPTKGYGVYIDWMQP